MDTETGADDIFGRLAEGFEGTWMGDFLHALPGLLPFIIGITFVVVLVIGFAHAVYWIGKGAGQLGIIEGYVGTIGAGKTTLAVQHALGLARARDAVLLSNIPILCGEGYTPMRRLFRWFGPYRPAGPYVPGCAEGGHNIDHQLLPVNDDGIDLAALTRKAFELRDAGRGLVLLMDEVGVVMPSRLWKDFSVALMWVLQQSRKLTCEWIWTAQDPAFVDRQLRSLTSAVHFVQSFPPPSIWRRTQGKRPWFLVQSTYLPTDAPRAHGADDERTKKRRIDRKVRRYKRAWEGAFDTDGVVLPSKHLAGAGVIIDAVGDRAVDRIRVELVGEPDRPDWVTEVSRS
jgi:hypothetical protein